MSAAAERINAAVLRYAAAQGTDEAGLRYYELVEAVRGTGAELPSFGVIADPATYATCKPDWMYRCTVCGVPVTLFAQQCKGPPR